MTNTIYEFGQLCGPVIEFCSQPEVYISLAVAGLVALAAYNYKLSSAHRQELFRQAREETPLERIADKLK